ncbi:MAG: Rid family detoxifying hydrolase [Pseudomonadota bacterium]
MKSIILCVSILVLAAGAASCWSSNASETTVKKVIFTPDAPKPAGPYSQGILFGATLYCAGQIGIDPNTGELVEGGIEAETDQVIRNLGAILRAANMDYEDVVMATIFLKDLDEYSTVNQVYARYFDIAPPARQAVEAGRIPRDANIEISVVAMK